MKKSIPLIAWLMWFIAAVFYSLDYFQHTAPSVLIEPIAHSLHISFITVGNIMSIYFPIYAVSQIPAGILLDKYGVRIVLSLACLTVSVGLLLMILPATIWLIAGRIFIAIGSAFAFLGALKTASDGLSDKVFPIAVGLTNTIGVMGGMLGQSFLNYLIIKIQWVHALWSIGMFGIVLSGFIFIFLKSGKKKSHRIKEKFYFTALKDKRIWLLALYAGIMVGTVVNAFSELYDVVFLEKSFHISSQTASIISTMVFVGIAIGGPLHGLIAKKFKTTIQWMLIAALMTILSFTGIILSEILTLNIYLLFFLYLSTGFFVSSMLLSFSQARCCYPKTLHATIFALINMVIGICGFIFQLLLGEVIEISQQYWPSLTNGQGFIVGFMALLIPLLFSWYLCLRSEQVKA